MTTHRVDWVDSGREPQEKPNPSFPDGCDVGPVGTPLRHCVVKLPYPAKRVGCYRVKCNSCEQLMLVTTAGRADDPRSVTVICRGRAQ